MKIEDNSLLIGNQGDKLYVKVRVGQGGMAVGISLSGLASAVANEGGIGIIATAGIGMNEPDFRINYLKANVRALRREIRKARKLTKGIIGINVMQALDIGDDLIRVAIAEGIDIIISGAGLPLELPLLLGNNMHTKLVPIVSDGRTLKAIMKWWWTHHDKWLPDAVVVEGPKAGGHIGFKVTDEYPDPKDDPKNDLGKLVKGVKTVIDEFFKEHGIDKAKYHVPIIAAGGIYTGEDIEWIRRQDADAVQLGSLFVTTIECDANIKFKETYLDAEEGDLVVIKSPVGMPGRALRNKFLDDVADPKIKTSLPNCPVHCIKSCAQDKAPYCIFTALVNAQRGKFRYGFAFAGSNAHRATEILSVHEVMEKLEREHREAEERWQITTSRLASVLKARARQLETKHL